MKAEKKVILFDYDGVIVDSLSFYATVLSKVSERFGNKKVVTEEIIRNEWGGGWQSFYERVLGIPTASTVEASLYYSKVRGEVEYSAIFPDMKEIIEKLSENFRLFIISASKTPHISKNLKFHGIHCFEDVCGQDLLPNIRKGDPDFFLQPMKKWGIDPKNAISIGDTVDEVEMGKAVGTSTIACAWGWQSLTKLKESNPDQIALLPGELLEKINLIKI